MRSAQATVLLAIREAPGSSADIVRRTELPKTTVLRALRGLAESDRIERIDGEWSTTGRSPRRMAPPQPDMCPDTLAIVEDLSPGWVTSRCVADRLDINQTIAGQRLARGVLLGRLTRRRDTDTPGRPWRYTLARGDQ